jgi:DUF1680 family protein
LINGEAVETSVENGYAEVRRVWKKGDVLQLNLEMKVKLMASNPLLEETRNQVAVMRGPVVYCLESTDLEGKKIDNVMIPANIKLEPKEVMIDGAPMMALTGVANYSTEEAWGANDLYREWQSGKQKVQITLIPYYAFGNRGHSEMTVWMPIDR